MQRVSVKTRNFQLDYNRLSFYYNRMCWKTSNSVVGLFFILTSKTLAVLQQRVLFYQKYYHIIILQRKEKILWSENKHTLSALSFFPQNQAAIMWETQSFPGKEWNIFLGGSHFKTTGSPSAASARASGRRSIPREFSDRLDVVWSGCLECKSHPWLISGWGAACVWMCSWGQFPHNHSEWIFLAR